MSDLDACFAEALAYTASLTPGAYTTFRRHLDPLWIDEYPAAELRILYHERWEIELGFGELPDRHAESVSRRSGAAAPTP